VNDGRRRLDPVDRALLQILVHEARLPHAELARRVKMSRPAVHNRLKRLEADRVIRGYRATFDWEAIGHPLTVFVLVRTVGPAASAAARAILAFSDDTATVDECFRVTGEWSLLLAVHASTARAVETLIDRIRALPNVRSTQTLVALSALHDEEF
jgi:Lrp/AsnC family leucine-responsive transcriptional regulator